MLDFLPGAQKVETPSPVHRTFRRKWSEYCGFFIEDGKLWRRGFAASMAFNFMLTGGLVYNASQSSVKPFVIKEDRLGAMTPMGPLGPPQPVTVEQIKQHLMRWVCDVRTVYTDVYAMRNIGLEAYAWTKKGSAAEQQLNDWFQSDPPQLRAQREGVGCKVELVSQYGNDTWNVEFTEEHRPVSGVGGIQAHSEAWQVSVKIEIAQPSTEEEWWRNPDGIYTTWFNPSHRTVK